ncbi:DnaB-like helicase C-terminal domain-containing protein [Haloferula sp. BvORR071]|uniref:replicative DNA helicase n=1 Tax=Haloferula sp. BvORR071 TaxID=1396141 RepID=UPI0005501B51|nr:DnaB-like helicase C-terminal domain-containing protein [Haloferula sp. BvORR071]
MIEKAVLSVLLREWERIDGAPDLKVDHFHLPGHRLLFGFLQEQARKGIVQDLTSLVEILHSAGQLEAIGGPAAVMEIYTYAPTGAYFGGHLAILRDKLARRQALAVAGEIERLVVEAETAQEIIEATSAPITEIHDTLAASRPAPTTRSVLEACINRFESLVKGDASPMGIKTSLPIFNNMFGGLHGKQAIVISAYPSDGKTTLAGQLAMDAALEEAGTLICSLEMPAEAMMNRLLAYVARLPGDAITDPLRYAREHFSACHPTKETLGRIGQAAKRIAGLPFAVEDMTGANVYQLAATIRRHHRRFPLRVVAVDFAQRIRPVPELRRESREQQLAHASNHLADLCKELGFTLLLPSQLNKEGAAKHAEAINEDADLHLRIKTEVKDGGVQREHVGLAVIKDRHHGHNGTILPVVFDAPMLRFVPKP